MAYNEGERGVDEPYLAVAQLRDQVLALEQSPYKRKRLWKDVQAVVEANSNIRTAQHEVRGDIHRTWEVVGDAHSFLQ